MSYLVVELVGCVGVGTPLEGADLAILCGCKRYIYIITIMEIYSIRARSIILGLYLQI